MNRRILSVACLVALVPCGAAIADDDFGLSKMSIYSTPDPIVTTTKAGEPGENELIDAYFDESPPVIPHVVDEYLPITISDNQCIDCHDAPDQIGKKLAKDEAPPSPASHYTDLRRAPDKVTNTLIGSRFVCTQCHAGQQDTAPLVESTYRQ